MVFDVMSGDRACFTCGHVTYTNGVPEPIEAGKPRRRPLHGGQSLL